MKADLNTNFEALFNEALAKWKIREDVLKPIDAKIKYQNWIKENITNRGITLKCDQFTGKPLSMSITVAGAED